MVKKTRTRTREEDAKARELLVNACLWQLVDEACRTTDLVTQRNKGLFEVRAMLEAWIVGGAHPWLVSWKQRKATNRPAPDVLEQGARRQAVLMVAALCRTGVEDEQARKMASKKLEAEGVFVKTPSCHTLSRWRRELGPLGDADKAIVEKAATQFGNNHDQLMDYFVGLAHFVNNPTAR